MVDESDEQTRSSARGEAAWRQATEEVAERNRRAQKLGREEREAYERGRNDARRAAQVRADAQLGRGAR